MISLFFELANKLSPFISAFLISIGTLCIIIELVANYDRSFLFSGLFLIILSLMFGAYFFLIAENVEITTNLLGKRIFHVIAHIGSFVFIVYFMFLIKSFNKILIIGHAITVMIIVSVSFSNYYLYVSDDRIVPTSLYDAFYTYNKGKKGNGLGLSIARSIIQEPWRLNTR